MDGSDELPASVNTLYRQILRNSELSTQVDVGLVADLAVELTRSDGHGVLGDCLLFELCW